jgi:hypothetical protein
LSGGLKVLPSLLPLLLGPCGSNHGNGHAQACDKMLHEMYSSTSCFSRQTCCLATPQSNQQTPCAP